MVEVDGDLLALLQSRIKDATLVSGGPTWGEMDDVRKRKLERMAAVRQRAGLTEAPNDLKTKGMAGLMLHPSRPACNFPDTSSQSNPTP